MDTQVRRPTEEEIRLASTVRTGRKDVDAALASICGYAAYRPPVLLYKYDNQEGKWKKLEKPEILHAPDGILMLGRHHNADFICIDGEYLLIFVRCGRIWAGHANDGFLAQ